MKKRFRRYQNILVTSGWGMIILGVWPIVQTVIFFFLMPEQFSELSNTYDVTFKDLGFVIAMTVGLMGFDLLFRILAGRAAIREGLGKKCSAASIVLGFIALIITAVNCFSSVGYGGANLGNADSIITAVIDFFMLFVNVQMLVALFVVKHARKKQMMADR